MTKKSWLTLFLFLATMGAILWGGPFLSKSVDKSYRNDIDKNGAIVKAVIYNKTANSKGRTVYFKYSYHGTQYTNQDEGRDFYNNLNNGDTIDIKIDTLNPDNSYINNY